jgi:hypothetical protein
VVISMLLVVECLHAPRAVERDAVAADEVLPYVPNIDQVVPEAILPLHRIS